MSLQQPGPPLISRLPLATNNQLEFWWQPPSTINSPITYYQFACSSIGYTQNLSSQAQETRVFDLTNGQYYQFTIRAANQYGLGSPAAFDIVQPGPRPANNNLIDVKMIYPGTFAQLTWKSIQAAGEPDNIGYALIAIPSTPTLSTVKVSANSTQQSTFIGPLKTDVYTFSVYSVNDARWQRTETTNSIIANTTLFTSPPTKPAIISFSTITNSSFTVIYTNPASQSTSYYSFLLNGLSTPTKTQTANTGSFNNLTAATTYSVIVTANNNIGSNPSNAQSVTTLIDTPNPVTNIQNGAGTSATTLTASWTPSPNATLPYTFTINGIPTIPQSQTTSSATFINLNPGTWYPVVVIANNSTGGRPSQSTDLTTAPAAPRNVNINYANPTGFTVNWAQGSANTIDYQISLDGGITVQSQTSPYTFTNLSIGNTYQVVVKARNQAGTTAAAPVSYALGLTTPQIEFFNNVKATSFNVFWSLATGADPIMYYISVDGGITYPFYSTTNNYTVTNMNPNTTYTVVVQASNSGVIKTSNSATVMTKPAPPYNITFTDVTQVAGTVNWLTAESTTPPSKPILTLGAVTRRTAQITWTPPMLSLVSSYSLNVNALGFQSFPGTVSSYTITNLTGNTSNTAFLIATNTAGRTDADPLYFMTALNPPPPVNPTNFITTSVSTTAISVSWTPVEDVEVYYLNTDGSQNYPYSTVSTATSFTYSPLTAGTNYLLTLVASNVSGNSGQATISTITVPNPPANVTVTSITQTSALVSWTAVTGATSYRVSINSGAYQLATGTSYQVTGLQPGSSTSVNVAATNASGSNAAATTILTVPSAPTNFQTTSIAATSIAVSWSAVTGASSYYLSNDGGSSYGFSTGSTSYTFTGLSPSTTYNYYVKAYNSSGYSSENGPLSVTTSSSPPAAPPTTPVLTTSSKTSSSFTVNWTGGVYATSYTYKINGVTTTPTTDNGVSAKNATFSGSTGMSYTVEVIAINSLGTASSGSGNSWTLNSAPASMLKLAGSSDLTTLVTSGTDGYLYTSSNSGVSWVQRTAPGVYSSQGWGFGCSLDGTNIVAIAGYASQSGCWISLDSGNTWSQDFSGVGYGSDSSGGGHNIASGGGKFYTFADGNAVVRNSTSGFGRWTACGNIRRANHLDCSDNGNVVVGSYNVNPYIWESEDAGVTFTQTGLSGGGNGFFSIACSGDGTKRVTGIPGGNIYIKSSGSSWDPVQPSLTGSWNGFACSFNGSFMIATGAYGGGVHTSSNAGQTWTYEAATGTSIFTTNSCLVSSDGQKMMAFVGGALYSGKRIFTITL